MHWLAVEEQRSRANIQLGQAEWSGGGGGGGGERGRTVGSAKPGSRKITLRLSLLGIEFILQIII